MGLVVQVVCSLGLFLELSAMVVGRVVFGTMIVVGPGLRIIGVMRVVEKVVFVLWWVHCMVRYLCHVVLLEVLVGVLVV